MKTITYLFLISIFIFCSCKSGKEIYNPDKKFTTQELKKDYQLFRNILEKSHPSLYWYISKDSLDYYFDNAYASIKDSMTESQFRMLLSFVISKIDCGHTVVKSSKAYTKYFDTAQLKTFPLGLKFWKDTMIVTANLNRRDSVIKRGTVLKSINGLTQPQLTDTFFNYISTDGHSECGKYQSLSTGFAFASLYKNIFGYQDKFDISYLDSNGQEQQKTIPLYDFRSDTMNRMSFPVDHLTRKKKTPPPKFSFFTSNLQLDTTGSTAFLTLNTFDRNNHLRKFFRQTFKAIEKNHIRYLIIDLRSNGGGDAAISTLFTRYLIDKKFKVADSLYALNRKTKYDRYIEKSFLYNTMLFFVTKKRSDGKYHFGYFERHYFDPKKKNHFEGQAYLLLGGNSFSATTLFAGALKGQKNITLVGEETGGGYYGNTAWIIPDVTLPITKVRFRLPRFRLIVDKSREKDGRGVMPDVWAVPSTEAIRKGIDFKAEKVRELIEMQHEQNSHAAK